jgi:hypothetical protein
MKQVKNIWHPNFTLGLLVNIPLFITAILVGNGNESAKSLAIITLLLAGIHWIWSMRDALTDRTLKNKEADNYFWFSLILLIPPIAGMMYYMIHDKRVRF